MNHHIVQAANVIQQGGIIAYPTEGVFGLGCDPLNPAAVARLLALKHRHPCKGIILIAHHWLVFKPFLSPQGFQRWQAIQEKANKEPCTWVLPTSTSTPVWIRGEHASIAIRVTTHPIAQALCRAAGFPIVSTSANKTGHPPFRDHLSVRLHFKSQLDYILAGKTGSLQKPTPIRDGLTRKLVRP